MTTANTILCSTWNGRFIFHRNEGVKLSYNQLMHPLWSLRLTDIIPPCKLCGKQTELVLDSTSCPRHAAWRKVAPLAPSQTQPEKKMSVCIFLFTIMYTMCPPGCYHNDFMATPELGHRMYGYTLLDCIVESQECSNCIYIYISI